MRWMREPNVAGSSKEKPDVKMAVSYINKTKSLTVLSPLSDSARACKDLMMALSGLISIVFFDCMYADMELSLKACAFMILSMFADHPYSPVTKMHGESTSWSETTTFSTRSPRTSFIVLHKFSNFALVSSSDAFSSSVCSSCKPSLVQQTNFLPSYSFNCWTAYSSIGSTMYKTS